MNAAFQPSGNEVKRAAFSEHRRSGALSKQQSKVIEALARVQWATRQELSERIGMPINSVCGRCKELLDLGCIEVAGTTTDKPARQKLELSERGLQLIAKMNQEGARHA